MTQTEELSTEAILQCTPATKARILAALVRERMVQCGNWLPFSIRDECDQIIGAFYPDRTNFERAESPPPMTAEERARFEEAMRHPERTFTLDEFLKEDSSEGSLPRSL